MKESHSYCVLTMNLNLNSRKVKKRIVEAVPEIIPTMYPKIEEAVIVTELSMITIFIISDCFKPIALRIPIS